MEPSNLPPGYVEDRWEEVMAAGDLETSFAMASERDYDAELKDES
jgi:hypothetical protein